jgi:hypothetical protein
MLDVANAAYARGTIALTAMICTREREDAIVVYFVVLLRVVFMVEAVRLRCAKGAKTLRTIHFSAGIGCF